MPCLLSLRPFLCFTAQGGEGVWLWLPGRLGDMGCYYRCLFWWKCISAHVCKYRCSDFCMYSIYCMFLHAGNVYIPRSVGKLRKFCVCALRLHLCEKALVEYLDTKRLAFPRFYFLSSSDLLDILSNGTAPLQVSQGKACRNIWEAWGAPSRRGLTPHYDSSLR